MPSIVAEVPHIKRLRLIVDSTEVHVLCTHKYTDMLLMFHSLVCGWTVCLALDTALMLEYFCDNIGLVLACLPSGSTNSTASHVRASTLSLYVFQ